MIIVSSSSNNNINDNNNDNSCCITGVCKINTRYVCSIITSASPPSPRSSKLKGKRRSR